MDVNGEKLKVLTDRWGGGPYVARSKVAEFSGGMLNPKTLANLDSLGQGPERIRYGKKIYYPVDELVEWMTKRLN